MQITQPFNRFGIAVIQKTALRTVQRGDHSHVLGIEREAEYIAIARARIDAASRQGLLL
jgi:hypothetical protein